MLNMILSILSLLFDRLLGYAEACYICFIAHTIG